MISQGQTKLSLMSLATGLSGVICGVLATQLIILKGGDGLFFSLHRSLDLVAR